MIAVLRLAFADLMGRWALMVGSALLVAAPVTGFLILDGLTRTVDTEFATAPTDDLIVEEASGIGEFLGSRIPAGIEDDLIAAGEPFAIPEIHTVTGTAADTAVLLRGVDAGRYRAVLAFDLVAGRPLGPDDPPRSAMLGVELAARRGVEVGGTIAIRGRPFEVVGLFEVGTYADYEAWVSISDAQEVLGWEDEVSLFVVSPSGGLAEGDVLPGGLAVFRRGGFAEVNDEWDPIIGLTTLAAFSLALAAAVVLGAVLWRLAWLRRRDLAVLRAIGMGRWVQGVFLAVQAVAVVVPGVVIGIVAALVAGRFVVVEAFGLSAHPAFDLVVIVRSMAVASLIAATALAAATARALRARPAALLRRW